MAIEVVAFGLGAILVLSGILGGGFEIREFKVPPIGKPLRFVATALGLFFTFVGIGLNVNGHTEPSESSVAAPVVPTPLMPIATAVSAPLMPTAPHPDVTHRPALIMAMRLADEVEITATRTLDGGILSTAYSGEALRTELAGVDYLRAQGVVSASRLISQQFEEFKVSEDERHAEVRVIERWQQRLLALDGSCIGMFPEHDAPQTVHLKRVGAKWMVDAVIHDLGGAVEPVPCEG